MKKLLIFVVCLLCFGGIVKAEDKHLDRDEKIFTMIFDLHSEEMGYDRTEQICGFGNSLKKKGYAIYKGIKCFPNKEGFIIINTNDFKRK